jgi:UDP-N-acetylglucosamine--N-acetylmuramyl-(pentapeptide) pyrophosphoryl-undecaprenol N-acetylglucosamine transferase
MFSGGGTGGHIYPALAIREALLEKCKDKIETAYLGLNEGLESKIVARIEQMPFLGVRAQGMPRNLSLKWFSFPFVNLAGIKDAVNHMREFKPDCVITTGGFVAFPALMAARLLGIKVFIHEQNAAMGITNRLFSGIAEKVFLTYESAATIDNRRILLTGNPVRKKFFAKSKNQGRFKKTENEFWIFAVGGSRGARSLNNACVDLCKTILLSRPEIKLLHISGERDYEMVKNQLPEMPENYILLPYLHDMKEAFDVADLVLSRAGATILSEIAVCARPAILVPFPYATDNHQEKNARVLENTGAAKVILDNELSGDKVIKLVDELIESKALPAMSEAMKKSRPDNVESAIVEQILACS